MRQHRGVTSLIVHLKSARRMVNHKTKFGLQRKVLNVHYGYTENNVIHTHTHAIINLFCSYLNILKYKINNNMILYYNIYYLKTLRDSLLGDDPQFGNLKSSTQLYYKYYNIFLLALIIKKNVFKIT